LILEVVDQGERGIDDHAVEPAPSTPILFDARTAHAEGLISYDEAGVVQLRVASGAAPLTIPLERQFPSIRATFDDLNKTLSRLSNSPRLDSGESLRESYEREVAHYEDLAATAYADGRWEPDYGTYVFDPLRQDLYLVAPEAWHRLALVTSNAMLLTDPEANWSWRKVRERLEHSVVGFAGISVGSNLLEGWLREGRPRRVKLADPDWLELPNFNRCERASLRHLAGSRAARFEPRNPYEVPRVPKVDYTAYEQRLVDPYLRVDCYPEGITRGNVDRFLLGDGDEPRIDVLVEETDNLDIKMLLRERCRAHGIDVIMLSDFGHRVHVLWNFFSREFSREPSVPMGFTGTDEQLLEALAAVRSGDRNKLYDFIRCLCGDGFAGPEFFSWLEGHGEQPTSSLPQAGATAMAAGGIGGKEIALHVLGHNHNRRHRRVIYDLLGRQVIDD
jgi:hypothetical protein